MSAKAIAGIRAAVRGRAVLVAAIVATFALALSTSARAVTITVDSLADTGGPGICVLRDAITAANMKVATNGCAAGTSNDTIQFSVTGTIALASTLPQVTDSLLAINGPAASRITIDGGGQVRVMQVALGATLNLNRLTITHGASPNFTDGGGIDNDGTLTVTDSTFSSNAAGSSGGSGGAIQNRGVLAVTNSTFSGNNAADYGGGIENNTGTLTVTNSTFSGGFTRGSDGGGGGGIDNEGGMLTVTNSTFSGNRSYAGGGISNLFDPIATLTVTNSTFSGNSAGAQGGAIDSQGTLTVTNSTFSDNRSGVGAGGIGVFSHGPGATLTVTSSTFSGTSIVNGAAGLPLAVASVKSTILVESGDGNCSGTITDVGYNISDDNSCGFSATGSSNNTNPMLSSVGLANNGGPTQTIALFHGSPAIDAIPLASCTDQASPPNPIHTDQRGFPRPDRGEGLCDIGAYEFQDTAFIPFSHLSGSMKIDPDAGVFYLWGGFTLGSGGSIDPPTQEVTFSVGSYAVTLPPGSFVKSGTGYVYQKTVNGIFLCILIEFTRYPGNYQLLANRTGGTLNGTTSPVPVTLTIGNNSGSTQMNATFD